MLNKSTPILIVGFGSIGKRHYRNLRSLGYVNLGVFDPVDSVFDGQGAIGRIKNLDIKTAKTFRIAFICSPNNLHIKHATICAEAGCDLFIEKPLSHNLKGVKKLERIVRKKKIITMVACNTRFHPCLTYMKKCIDSNKIGKIFSIRHEFGYYLPYWRPNQDYKKNYACKKAMGGGITLDDIHEFDLLFWLNDFSKVVQKFKMAEKIGNLKIETEDSCMMAFKFRNGVIGHVMCDYLQQSYTRNCKVIGEKGNLVWNVKDNAVWIEKREAKTKLMGLKKFDYNEVYIDEVKDFFRCVETRAETQNSLSLAAITLKNIL